MRNLFLYFAVFSLLIAGCKKAPVQIKYVAVGYRGGSQGGGDWGGQYVDQNGNTQTWNNFIYGGTLDTFTVSIEANSKTNCWITISDPSNSGQFGFPCHLVIYANNKQVETASNQNGDILKCSYTIP